MGAAPRRVPSRAAWGEGGEGRGCGCVGAWVREERGVEMGMG